MRYYLLNLYRGRVATALIADLTCMALVAVVIWCSVELPVGPEKFTEAALGLAFLLLVVLDYADAYGLCVLGSGRRTLQSLLIAFAASTGLLLGSHLLLDLPGSNTGLVIATEALALLFVMLTGERLAFRLISGHPRWTHRILIIGASDLARAIARAVRDRSNLGAEVIGFLTDDVDEHGGWIEGYPVLGWVNEFPKVLEKERIDRVVVASKRRDEHFPAEELLAAKLAGIRVESGVNFYERVTGRVYLRGLRPSYLIFGGGFEPGRAYEAAKRAIDVVVAGLGLLLALPLLAVAALAIRLDSEGPIFFTQVRVGRGGRRFQLWKLRSMHLGAEEDTGPVWTEEHDERVTRVGRLLRRTRFDEVPQLWNVLRGDMSLVGPRPERPEFVDELSAQLPYFRLRLGVKPGVTGWAQIRHGYVNDVMGWESKLALDLYYMKHRSLSMDLLILWKTAKTMLLMRGV